ncbi:MAG: Glu-tRNA(Gln) amidotransferase subunit GatE [Candidatus Diapherotrites archaeon]|nr:Glu-tRNA(Gln) amidotransferase subunit GatE [Candidatus Diapherotrites archaeon]
MEENIEITAGLEIHQQIGSKKLFCRCKAQLKEDNPDAIIRRRIRLAASELGEFDKAALEVFKKKYYFVYQYFKDVCCLVELDEEPPHSCDIEALKTALEVSLLINAKIPDILYVMRKTVIDGSNVSGFQRTMLVSIGGNLKLKNGKEVQIQSLALEEDAARLIAKDETKKEIIYNLDRLGIPLIELSTTPCLKTPTEVKEAALAIGELLRITCKARRGLGTIRQDLNISIKGGARVEIKGVQELELIDEYVRKEVLRQKNLIEIKKILEQRKLSKEELDEEPLNINELMKECKCNFIKEAVQNKKFVYAKKFAKMRDIFGKEIQPNRRFGTEIVSYLKAKTNIKGFIHSDEDLKKYKFEDDEIRKIKEKLRINEEDAFVIIVGNEEDCLDALRVITERCKQAIEGVPEETRNALEDGNSEYSRPLPGAARMYPETDIPPILIDKELLEEIKRNLPKTADERFEIYTKKYGLSEKLANEMKLNNYARFFEEMVEDGVEAKTLAVFLLEWITQLKRENLDVDKIDEIFIKDVIDVYMKGIVTRDNLLDFIRYCLISNEPVKEAAIKFKKDTISIKEVENKIEEIVKTNRELIKDKKEYAFSALMGDVMKELKGKIQAKILSEILRRKIAEEIELIEKS